MTVVNQLSIDVEDYFHVSAFETVSPSHSWDCRELRVEQNVRKILALLRAVDVKATFFILGWIAERCPSIVKMIADAGHEIASHGYSHRRISTQTRADFRQDVRRSKAILEDQSGVEVFGYRAPSYSITRDTLWAFDELYEAGYRYDSSVFPIRHDFYGISDWPRWPGRAVKVADGNWRPETPEYSGGKSIYEFPITTLSLGGRNLPIAGGGYFRLFPYWFTRYGLQSINRKDGRPFVFYLHPWELDPDQPRMHGVGLKSRFRHYLNLHKTEGRFRRLLEDFRFKPIGEAFRDLQQG